MIANRQLRRIGPILVVALLLLAFAATPAEAHGWTPKKWREWTDHPHRADDDHEDDDHDDDDDDERDGDDRRSKRGKAAKRDAARVAGEVDCPRNVRAGGSGTIVLTFDDGYRVHHDAGKTLKGAGMCGTFFVVGNQLRAGPYYSDYLSAGEVRDLAAGGHDVQSHTMTHADLTTLTPDELAWELRTSREILAGLTGRSVQHLAYPYGAHDEDVRAATAQTYATGRVYYNALHEIEYATSSLYELPALGIEETTTLAQAKAYVDWARDHDRTLVLVFHELGGAGAYAWPKGDFKKLVQYIASSDVGVRTVTEVGAAGGFPP